MKYPFLFVLVLLHLAARSQLRIVNHELAEQDSAILFSDLYNHLSIEGLRNFTRHQVTIQGKGWISFQGDNRMLVHSPAGPEVVLRVFRLQGEEKKLVHTRRFQVQLAGSPEVVLEEKEDESRSNGQILNWSALEVRLPNPNYGGGYEVAHFEISLVDTSGQVLLDTLFVSGKFLGKEVMDRLKALPPGSPIRFTQVILTYRDGGYRKYKDFQLRKK